MRAERDLRRPTFFREPCVRNRAGNRSSLIGKSAQHPGGPVRESGRNYRRLFLFRVSKSLKSAHGLATRPIAGFAAAN